MKSLLNLFAAITLILVSPTTARAQDASQTPPPAAAAPAETAEPVKPPEFEGRVGNFTFGLDAPEGWTGAPTADGNIELKSAALPKTYCSFATQKTGAASPLNQKPLAEVPYFGLGGEMPKGMTAKVISSAAGSLGGFDALRQQYAVRVPNTPTPNRMAFVAWARFKDNDDLFYPFVYFSAHCYSDKAGAPAAKTAFEAILASLTLTTTLKWTP